MTQRLYYENSYLTEFDAKIVEQYKKGEYFVVVLNQTAFYPTSGGQLSDRGFLNDHPVIDVIEEGGEIAHIVMEPIDNPQIKGKIDWQRRFDFMQQHTGFHILAQSFLRVLGAETLSSHLGEKTDTIDVGIQEMSWEKVEQVEKLANETVLHNLPVSSYWIEKKDLEKVSLRKPPKFFHRPIRLVDIEGFDLDPCGGTHVNRTGEVGIIKILSWEKVRNNIRCTFVAGERAIFDYQKKTKISQQIGRILSVTPDEMVDQVNLLKQNIKNQNRQIKKLKTELLSLEAQRLLSTGEKYRNRLWLNEFREKEAGDIRHLAVMLSKELPVITAFYCKAEPAYFVMSCGEGLPVDFSSLIPDLREILQGKGGGNAKFVEFKFIDTVALPEALRLIENFSEQL